jgi:hypothetical protein
MELPFVDFAFEDLLVGLALIAFDLLAPVFLDLLADFLLLGLAFAISILL